MISTTYKQSRLLKAMRPPTVAALLARQMVAEVVTALQAEGSKTLVNGRTTLSQKASLIIRFQSPSYMLFFIHEHILITRIVSFFSRRETTDVLKEWAGVYISSVAKNALDSGKLSQQSEVESAVVQALRASGQLQVNIFQTLASRSSYFYSLINFPLAPSAYLRRVMSVSRKQGNCLEPRRSG
jgi:hypothetical protein